MSFFGLEDALDNKQGGLFPGQPAPGPWPNQPNQPPHPAWPNQPNQHPAFPNQPNQPPHPAWPNPQPFPPSGYGGPTGPAGPKQKDLSVPYGEKLPNGVYDNMLITISGIIKPNANKITVDLSTDKDLAFHFNPRFNEDGRQVIVRNCRMGTRWGKEERDGCSFPFRPGQPFEIKILCTSREFKVAVNGSHLLEFKHRVTHLRAINTLSVYNDLTLTNVNVSRV